MESSLRVALARCVESKGECKRHALKLWLAYQVLERAILLIAEEGSRISDSTLRTARLNALDDVATDGEAFRMAVEFICPMHDLGEPEKLLMELLGLLRAELRSGGNPTA
ncbi:hypothetical protein [Oceanithermus sp.]